MGQVYPSGEVEFDEVFRDPRRGSVLDSPRGERPGMLSAKSDVWSNHVIEAFANCSASMLFHKYDVRIDAKRLAKVLCERLTEYRSCRVETLFHVFNNMLDFFPADVCNGRVLRWSVRHHELSSFDQLVDILRTTKRCTNVCIGELFLCGYFERRWRRHAVSPYRLDHELGMVIAQSSWSAGMGEEDIEVTEANFQSGWVIMPYRLVEWKDDRPQSVPQAARIRQFSSASTLDKLVSLADESLLMLRDVVHHQLCKPCYYVAWHLGAGNDRPSRVEGLMFFDLKDAQNCYSMKYGGKHPAILMTDTFEELRYFGLRGARIDDFRAWMERQHAHDAASLARSIATQFQREVTEDSADLSHRGLLEEVLAPAVEREADVLAAAISEAKRLEAEACRLDAKAGLTTQHEKCAMLAKPLQVRLVESFAPLLKV